MAQPTLGKSVSRGSHARILTLQTETFSGRKGHCFDLVSVEITNECAIIVGIIILADTGRALICPASCPGSCMKTADGFSVRCLKGDMDTVPSGRRISVHRRLDAENNIRRTVVGGLVGLL